MGFPRTVDTNGVRQFRVSEASIGLIFGSDDVVGRVTGLAVDDGKPVPRVVRPRARIGHALGRRHAEAVMALEAMEQSNQWPQYWKIAMLHNN